MPLKKPTTKLKPLLSDPWCDNKYCLLRKKRNGCGRHISLLPVSIASKYLINTKTFESKLIGDPTDGGRSRQCLGWFPEEIGIEYINKFVK